VKKLFAVTLLILPFLTPMVSSAETTRYVSDELEITMRNGQGVKFAIRKMLSSGTKLDVIETDPTGYSKVRTSNGTEGWVLTRYLDNMPSSRDRLAASEQKIANLELEIAQYKSEIEALSSQNSDTGSQNLTLTETSQRLSKELENLRRTASNAVALDNESRLLKEGLQEKEHEAQLLIIENSALKDNNAKTWFLVGAAVLIAGLLLGLIIPRLRFQKKSSWGSF
jgi:SH3 domain protein